MTRKQMRKVGEGSGQAGLKALRFRFLEFALRREGGHFSQKAFSVECLRQ